MTPAELDRLDRLMAERLMKWQYSPEGGARKADGHWIYVPAWSQDENVLYELDEWTPSRDIAQAMMCAEKVSKRTWICLMCTNGDDWSCKLTGLKYESYARSGNPSLAICLAIEKWLEGKK